MLKPGFSTLSSEINWRRKAEPDIKSYISLWCFELLVTIWQLLVLGIFLIDRQRVTVSGSGCFWKISNWEECLLQTLYILGVKCSLPPKSAPLLSPLQLKLPTVPDHGDLVDIHQVSVQLSAWSANCLQKLGKTWRLFFVVPGTVLHPPYSLVWRTDA